MDQAVRLPTSSAPPLMDAVVALPYAPSLDGLRAVAVSIVFASHSMGLFGGMLGVDVFFVLSGYLITLVLLKDQIAHKSLADFYRRRFLRLFPALFFVSITAFGASFYLHHNTMRGCEFLGPVLWVANWTKVAGLECPYYMGHTWSLAVEEQFYLLWPTILLLCLRKLQIRGALYVSLCLAAISAVWRMSLAYEDIGITHLFFSFDTRCDGLLIGAATALLQQYLQGNYLFRLARLVWIPAALILMYIVLHAVRHTEFFFGGYTLVALLVAPIVVAGSRKEQGLMDFTLGLPPMAYLGRLSYSIYLWHYPIVIGATEFGLSDTQFRTYTILGTLGMAAFSYHVVEKPFLRLRHTLPRSDWLGWIAVFGSLTGILIGLYIYAF